MFLHAEVLGENDKFLASGVASLQNDETGIFYLGTQTRPGTVVERAQFVRVSEAVLPISEWSEGATPVRAFHFRYAAKR